MSRTRQRLMTRDDVLVEHELLARQESKDSPVMEHLEGYYTARPAGYQGKIDLTWLPRSWKEHIKTHIALRLAEKAGRRRKGAGVARRLVFRTLLRDPTARRAETRRYRFGKTQRGRVYKQSKKTGRFVAFSQAERKEVRSWRQERK